MAIVDQKSPDHWGSSVASYQWNMPATADIDVRRIGRCHNLEAMLETYARKHGYLITLHHDWTVRANKGDRVGEVLASFPIYELALQYVLDAIDADAAATDETGA